MKKVDLPQVLISTAAIFGIGLLWYDFNMKLGFLYSPRSFESDIY